MYRILIFMFFFTNVFVHGKNLERIGAGVSFDACNDCIINPSRTFYFIKNENNFRIEYSIRYDKNFKDNFFGIGLIHILGYNEEMNELKKNHLYFGTRFDSQLSSFYRDNYSPYIIIRPNFGVEYFSRDNISIGGEYCYNFLLRTEGFEYHSFHLFFRIYIPKS